MDRMLNVESGDEDAIYRIQRPDRGIVYVTVIGESFLPGNDRNHGRTYPLHDIDSLDVVREYKSRTSKVTLGEQEQEYFLKIARFPSETPWVIQEIESYHHLADFPLVPRFVGHVYETSQDRVIGFLTEEAKGRFPGIEDLEACSNALDTLHSYLIHGDLVKYKVIVTKQGPKFIDFENSVLVGTEEWSSVVRDEKKLVLGAKLADESSRGRPWYIV